MEFEFPIWSVDVTCKPTVSLETPGSHWILYPASVLTNSSKQIDVALMQNSPCRLQGEKIRNLAKWKNRSSDVKWKVFPPSYLVHPSGTVRNSKLIQTRCIKLCQFHSQVTRWAFEGFASRQAASMCLKKWPSHAKSIFKVMDGNLNCPASMWKLRGSSSLLRFVVGLQFAGCCSCRLPGESPSRTVCFLPHSRWPLSLNGMGITIPITAQEEIDISVTICHLCLWCHLWGATSRFEFVGPPSTSITKFPELSTLPLLVSCRFALSFEPNEILPISRDQWSISHPHVWWVFQQVTVFSQLGRPWKRGMRSSSGDEDSPQGTWLLAMARGVSLALLHRAWNAQLRGAISKWTSRKEAEKARS